LQDLLRVVQPLELNIFEGSNFEEGLQVGEGASYRVRRCVHRRSGQVVAMKQVKLPPKSSDLDAFHTRVACVLRDIEVMNHPPLAKCKHILHMLGYGWRLQHESVPFLVTEYAPYGTLRQYLLQNRSEFCGRHKLQLCRDVSAGLEELHLAGVAHGDLKLDNILVVPGEADAIDLPMVNPSIVVKLADFGSSLVLCSDQNGGEQIYNGTEM
jgi:serine/threonine protein kinase